ncbi:MAG: molybdopterin-dependent oxidoreductase, partial [Halomonas sp.]|nr:molybdopterin-dependent oxidoreductase [Halomonas sp.]
LYQRLPRARVDAALKAADSVVVIDHQRTETWSCAHLGLPAATFAEGDGTLVSLEGRAQRFFQVFDPRYIRPETHIHESWRWLHALKAERERRRVGDVDLDAVTRACAERHPALAGIVDAAPHADFRIEGLKLAREPHRYSGRTAMRANLDVNEPRAPQDPDSPFSFSMEGYNGFHRPRQEVAFAWAPGWNSPQAWNKFTDEVGGHLRAGDPGVRLLAPQPGAYAYASAVPAGFVRRDDAWQVIVLPRLFGGEETSQRAEPIAERAAPPVLTLAAEDAQRLGLAEGEPVALETGTGQVVLPLHSSEAFPAGLVGVPAGLTGDVVQGDWGRLRAAGDAAEPLDANRQARPGHEEDRP